MMNSYLFLKQTAEKFPDHIAISDEHGDLTYAELEQSVSAAADVQFFKELDPGNGVALIGKNSRDFIIIAYAVLKNNFVLLPVAHTSTEAEIMEFIKNTDAHKICFTENVQYLIKNAEPLSVDGLKEKWYYNANKNVTPDAAFCKHIPDAAFMRYTSGTTGTSKGVILSHRSIEERTRIANGVLKLDENDTVIWVLSMAFHFVVSIMLYIRYGCRIVLNNDFLAASILSSINKYNATFLYASPMHIRLLANDRSGIKMDTVHTIISTSTSITKDQCESFYLRYNKPVTQAYGIIEIGLPVINNKLTEQHPDAIGYAVPGMDIKILDANGEAVPEGTIGNLAMYGPGMFDGYLSPPLLREDVLKHGYFFTGDQAVRDNSGLISLCGRIKSMINVGGNKVFPEEVEAVIMKYIGVEHCRVSGFKHPMMGESVQAEVIFNQDVNKPDTEELRNHCKAFLSSYKVPQKIIFVESLPMTASGKVRRTQDT